MRLLRTFMLCGLTGLVLAFQGGPRPERERSGLTKPKLFTLNALDHLQNIYDFRTRTWGLSRQLDTVLREYVGDVLFVGETLSILENDRDTGHFVDLGKEGKPDTEFAPFYGLKIFKRTFRTRQFPFFDRYLPYGGVDSDAFFNDNRDPLTTVGVKLGHTYLLRLFDRTRVATERILILKVLEFVPGVKVSVIWRELPLLERT